jgi:polar amino acid transport system substrate-binding protein
MFYYPLRARRVLLSVLLIMLPMGLVYGEQRLVVLTENWPPFNYEKDGEVVGFATEIVKATLKNAEIDYDIRLGVWKGVYDKVLSQHDILVYTITRTKPREDLFDWIGPFAPREQSLFKLKSRKDIKLTKLDDARKFLIGLQDQDAITQDLIQAGFSEDAKNLHVFSKRILAYRSLFAGRVDLVTGQDITVRYH